MGMTIMDKINDYAIKEGFTPVTGSIVDCLNNVIVNKGGTPTGGSIADALEKLNSIDDTPIDG